MFLANPVVTRLHRRGLPRVLGAAITYLGFFIGVGLLGLLLSPLLGNQFDQLSERLPELRRDVEKQIDKYAEQSEGRGLVHQDPVGEGDRGPDERRGPEPRRPGHHGAPRGGPGLPRRADPDPGPDRGLLPADGPARHPKAVRGADPRGVEAPGAVPRAPAEPDRRRLLPRPARGRVHRRLHGVGRAVRDPAAAVARRRDDRGAVQHHPADRPLHRRHPRHHRGPRDEGREGGHRGRHRDGRRPADRQPLHHARS